MYGSPARRKVAKGRDYRATGIPCRTFGTKLLSRIRAVPWSRRMALAVLWCGKPFCYASCTVNKKFPFQRSGASGPDICCCGKNVASALLTKAFVVRASSRSGAQGRT
jgi:hypothetical protein